MPQASWTSLDFGLLERSRASESVTPEIFELRDVEVKEKCEKMGLKGGKLVLLGRALKG